MLGAAVLGLLSRDALYRDNLFVRAAWLGNDLVTVLVAVPLLVGASARVRHGSVRGILVAAGVLAYAAYNYAFYLFGAAFNALFLAYAAILALSTLGLVAGLTLPNVRRLAASVQPSRAHRRVGAAVVAVSGFLGLFWSGLAVGFVLTGEPPAMVAATGHPTNVTGALDLWLVVTFGLLGGVWLVRGRGWGFVVSAVWTVKGAVYMTALSTASVAAYRMGAAGDLLQLAVWLPIGLVCAVGATVLLRGAGSAGAGTDV